MWRFLAGGASALLLVAAGLFWWREYLANRRKAFAKLDANGDGKLSFEEYSVKAITKFGTADGDHSGLLTPAEFATTRVVRKTRPRADCPPPAREDTSKEHDN